MFSVKSITQLGVLVGMLGNQVLADSVNNLDMHAKYNITPAEHTRFVDIKTNDILASYPDAYAFDVLGDEGTGSKTFKWVYVDKNDDTKEEWSIELTAYCEGFWPETDVAVITLSLDRPWATLQASEITNSWFQSDKTTYKCNVPLCGDAPAFGVPAYSYVRTITSRS
ncbi:uncharacterized protein I206_105387 [Kwoniella pini CBS 10737]|uniref:Uncharacterized protein n=1 Tax=Kwoniella pini CBS 10737 TaxID=1296096 RepID=A0A1B9I4D0_9TREE|nr:uncharacterized protein I206_03706 [Kwoniella pini CBS 10737]OCF50385.1 hypothetical protein I206_03706 [Kwoniella pini CBS 10737]